MSFQKTALILALLAFNPAASAQTPTPVATPDEHLSYWIRTLQTHPLRLVRKNAAHTLGKLANREALPVLIAALKDQDSGVRVESAKSLGLLGDERAFSVLTDLASSETDREVRRAASDSIEKIKATLESQKQRDLKEQALHPPLNP